MWECEKEDSDMETTPKMKPKEKVISVNDNIRPFDNTTACFPNRKMSVKTTVDREKKLYRSLVDKDHPR